MSTITRTQSAEILARAEKVIATFAQEPRAEGARPE